MLGTYLFAAFCFFAVGVLVGLGHGYSTGWRSSDREAKRHAKDWRARVDERDEQIKDLRLENRILRTENGNLQAKLARARELLEE